MSKLNPEFVAQVKKIRAVLDQLDYYQLLRITPEATPQQIRAGYHQQARTFHPDRFHHLNEPELLADLTLISKRVTEAYVILRDPAKRAQYTENIKGEKRATSLRYRESHEGEQRDKENARRGTTQQGRNLLEQALAAHRQGNKAAAIQSLKMALVYERDNAWFQELLAEWTQA